MHHKGSRLAEYLVESTAGTPKALARKDLSSQQARELANARTQLNKLEAQIRSREVEIKQRLVTWYREEDRRIKQERASARSPELRRAITQRTNARRAANDAYLRALRRAATGR